MKKKINHITDTYKLATCSVFCAYNMHKISNSTSGKTLKRQKLKLNKLLKFKKKNHTLTFKKKKKQTAINVIRYVTYFLSNYIGYFIMIIDGKGNNY